MKPARPSIGDRIGPDAICNAIVKTIGYGKIPCQEVLAKLKDVIARRGQPTVDAAARELLAYEQHGDVLYALIKPALHVHCRQLLGPMPSEWKDWYVNADGSERPGRPQIWPPVLPGPPLPEPTSFKPGPRVNQGLEALPHKVLAERLEDARHRISVYGPHSGQHKRAEADRKRIEAEYVRRKLTLPVASTSKKRTKRKAR